MRLFLVCFGLAFWLPNSTSVRAQVPEKISGILRKIDVKTGTLTILRTKPPKEEKTFSLVKPDIEVTTDLGKARLTDLSPGNVVHLQLNDLADVEAIRAEFPTVRAGLTAIDIPQRTLRVLTENLARQDLTVSEKTKIVHLGKDLALKDLKVNQWLEITSSLDGKSAMAIEVHVAGTRNGKIATGKMYGDILALDVELGIMLFHQTQGREKLMSFAVDKDVLTWVVLGRRPLEVLNASQTLPSKSAVLYLSPDRQGVKRILVEAPQVRGLIKSVEIEKRRLSVQENGTTKVWDFPAEVKVMHGKKKGKPVDLQVDTQVSLVLSLDRTKLRAVVVASP